jgi:hypothetical protein
LHHIPLIFADGREVAANAAKALGTLLGPKGARDFLLDFRHPNIAFRLVIIEGDQSVSKNALQPPAV